MTALDWSAAPDHFGRTVYAAVDHADGCAVCRAGGNCAAGDQAMTEENSAYQLWRSDDPVGARAYVQAEWAAAVEADRG